MPVFREGLSRKISVTCLVTVSMMKHSSHLLLLNCSSSLTGFPPAFLYENALCVNEGVVDVCMF